MYTVAVIGVGSMGQHHARVYSELDNVKLVGVADLNEKQVNEIAEKFNTTAYTDYKELIDAEKPDAITVAVPTIYHQEVCLYALDRGIHVLCEKPLAHSMEAAKEIAEKAHSNKLKLMVGHIERFNPATQALKKQLDKNVIGRLINMASTRVGPFTNRITDVGIILDLGVHDIDLMSYLFNDSVHGAFADAGQARGQDESYAQMMIKFKNGGTGIIQTNRLTPEKERKIIVTGEHGIAIADLINKNVTVINGSKVEVPVEDVEPLKSEVQHFIDCIKHDRRPLVNGIEGMHALEAALISMESYQNKQFRTVKNGYHANQYGLELNYM